jgi:hypothetical protein
MAHFPNPEIPEPRFHSRGVALLRMLGLIVVLGFFLALVLFAGLLMAYT